jgi:hypothetical protein
VCAAGLIEVLDSFSRLGHVRHMPDPRPLSDDEAVDLIAAAIRGAGGRPLTREADLLLATIAAECLYDRLALAGVVLTLQAE